SLSHFSFFLYRSLAPRDLHSFPTRRSSDLRSSIEITKSVISDGTANGQPSTSIGGIAITCSISQRPLGLCQCHMVLLSVAPTKRSEEHTSELQSLRHLVCRLLLEKKKKQKK